MAKTKSVKAKRPPVNIGVSPLANGVADEILTLAEAAAWLRVPESELKKSVERGDIPGQRVGDNWRLLRAAVRDWLAGRRPKTYREQFLAMAGSMRDDPYMDELLEGIYRGRGRPMTEKAQ